MENVSRDPFVVHKPQQVEELLGLMTESPVAKHPSGVGSPFVIFSRLNTLPILFQYFTMVSTVNLKVFVKSALKDAYICTCLDDSQCKETKLL